MVFDSEISINANSIDLSKICCLDDNQLFYEKAIRNYVENSATRFLATLYLIGRDGNNIAVTLFKTCENIDFLSRLFLQYREIESSASSLISSFENNNISEVHNYLLELYALIYPLKSFVISSLPLEQIKVSKGENVRFPLLNGIYTANENCNLKNITKRVLKSFNTASENSNKSEWKSDLYSISQIRISPSSIQPFSVGNEFALIEKNQLALPKCVLIAQKALNGLATLDCELATIMSQIMKLVTVVPRKSSIVRKAGSVSSLPGWAWQDIEPENEWIKEYCHLSVQLTHEFFHTKVNLLEKTILLYNTDGNSPEIFSPWKNMNRPLRQVIHALMTFSAGAAVWVKLLNSSHLDIEPVYEQANEYLTETLKFAELAHQNLTKTGNLTSAGLLLVDSCLENLRKVVN